MKTNFETLIEASTPGELKHDPAGRQVIDCDCIARMEWAYRPRPQSEANNRRFVISWNRFPQAVELLRQYNEVSPCRKASALLAAIEKESA